VKHFSEIPGSEGAMLKLADSNYPLSGHTGKWMKFKKEADIDAEVIEVHRVKDTDAYNYLCVIRDGGKRVPVGRTYNVRFERDGKPVQVPIGGIIRVAFVNLNRYNDPRTGEVWYNWWAPRPIEWREDKKTPDNTETANRIVQATGGEVEEKPYPTRYKVALKLKEAAHEIEEYSEWLEKSYPVLYDMDPVEQRICEAIGEDQLAAERKRLLERADVFWDDYFTEDEIFEAEKLATPPMIASESVYAFAAWLSSRKNRTVFSSSDDAAIIAELVNEFVKENCKLRK